MERKNSLTFNNAKINRNLRSLISNYENCTGRKVMNVLIIDDKGYAVRSLSSHRANLKENLQIITNQIKENGKGTEESSIN